jgi:hypothetical protein
MSVTSSDVSPTLPFNGLFEPRRCSGQNVSLSSVLFSADIRSKTPFLNGEAFRGKRQRASENEGTSD